LLPLQLLQPLQGRLEAEQLLYLQLQRLFKQPNKTINSRRRPPPHITLINEVGKEKQEAGSRLDRSRRRRATRTESARLNARVVSGE
jgi:hypothetical protein